MRSTLVLFVNLGDQSGDLDEKCSFKHTIRLTVFNYPILPYLERELDTNVPVKLKPQHPPRAYPGNLTLCCARGVGNLTVKVFAGVGNLKTAWEGWGI